MLKIRKNSCKKAVLGVNLLYAMKMRKMYTFSDYSRWDDTLHAAGEEFRESFMIYPNRILVCRSTLSQIWIEVKKSNDFSRELFAEEIPSELDEIDYFIDEEWEAFIILEETLSERQFVLDYGIFSDDDGGEECSIDDGETNLLKKVKNMLIKMAA